jgi:hypothetical protein
LRSAARLLLLGAVLAGIFGMHALTAHDAGAGHGALPMTGPAAHGGSAGHEMSRMTAGLPGEPAMVAVDGRDSAAGATGVGSAAVAAVPPGAAAAAVAAPGGPVGGHSAMAACILFLAVGGVALLSALLRRRGRLPAVGSGRLAVVAVTGVRRRGPPPGWPRVSLQVIRV